MHFLCVFHLMHRSVFCTFHRSVISYKARLNLFFLLSQSVGQYELAVFIYLLFLAVIIAGKSDAKSTLSVS